jgi:hypothetical protein
VSPEKSSPEDIVLALRDGRMVTTHADGSIEIGPEEPIDPEEQARADALALGLDAEHHDDSQ